MASQPNPKLPVQDQIELTDQPPSASPPAIITTVQDLRKDQPKPVEEKYQAVVATSDNMHFAGAVLKYGKSLRS